MTSPRPASPPVALVEQLSFYFSDANLRRDRFLLKLTGEHGTAAVELTTLASFRRVAALAPDAAVLREAARRAQGLQLSEDGVRVARTRPLPAADRSEPRTVYVEPMPPCASIESVRALFGGCGEVHARARAAGIFTCASIRAHA